MVLGSPIARDKESISGWSLVDHRFLPGICELKFEEEVAGWLEYEETFFNAAVSCKLLSLGA